MTATEDHTTEAGRWVAGALRSERSRTRAPSQEITLSAFHHRALRALAEGMNTGIYNLSVKWAKAVFNDRLFSCVMFCGDLSTFDFNALTRLVIVAHDDCLRISLAPAARDYFRVTITERERGADNWSRHHPTMEEAIVAYRLSPVRGRPVPTVTQRGPAKYMDPEAIVAELTMLQEQFAAYRADGAGHGGSPGEGIYERMGELEQEQRRRAAGGRQWKIGDTEEPQT